MNVVCYSACVVAVISALLVIVQRNAMHALLYLVVMLLALGLIFFTLGAPLLAVLEIAVYAGAIIVLFVFVVMMLQLGAPPGGRAERPRVAVWGLPVLLSLVLLALAVYGLVRAADTGAPAGVIGPRQVGISLFRDYLIAVELASLLILAGLVGAFHLAPPTRHRAAEADSDEAGPGEAADGGGSRGGGS